MIKFVTYFGSETTALKSSISNLRVISMKNTLSFFFFFLSNYRKVAAAAAASRFSRVRLCVTHRRQPPRFPHPWDSPGKNTGVGCHFLLQCMKVKSESEDVQLYPTLSDTIDCSLPGSSVHGIFQARVLELVAIAFSTRKIVPFNFLYCGNFKFYFLY